LDLSSNKFTGTLSFTIAYLDDLGKSMKHQWHLVPFKYMHAYIHSVQWQVSNILTLPFTTISFSTEVFRSSDNLLTGQLPQFPVKISEFGHVPGSLHFYYPIELFFSNPFCCFVTYKQNTLTSRAMHWLEKSLTAGFWSFKV
jgi:hypothetical protein